MTEFEGLVEEAFADGGALARARAEFSARPGQTQMALAVAGTLEQGARLVVEAGTGVGKSFAYLVPVVASGKRALISTATKTLQDQLFFKDLPAVREALGVSIDIALLKGRSNYVCLHRLAQAGEDARLPSRESSVALRRVQRFAMGSATGDKAELTDVPEDHAIWPLVTSTKDNCLGSECPDFSNCFVMKARRRALAADVTVINHHLFFADAMLRDSGAGELLPSAQAIVFDEAHSLGEVGVQFAGVSLSTHQVVEFARDLLVAGHTHARGQADWAALSTAVIQFCRELRLAFGQGAGRLAWDGVYEPDGSASASLWAAKIGDLCAGYAAKLEEFAAAAPELERMYQRALELKEAAHALLDEARFAVRYIELGQYTVRFRASPLSIQEGFGAWTAQYAGALVFTSATLAGPADAGEFEHFRADIGIAASRNLSVASPFDYARQGRLFIPREMPPPNTAGFEEALVTHLAPLIRANAGGTLVLCTSLRAMRRVGELLNEARLGIDVLVQDQLAKREALSIMRDRRAVLVGSQSFWEGVDLPGTALQLVVIDKLPFAAPDDPVLQARFDEAKRRGGSGFNDVSLPRAALLLKQGAGRLIRSQTDSGVLAIFDKRVLQASYSKALMGALPPFLRVSEAAEAASFLAQIQAPDHS